ncbi:DnaJ family domain-containing protein [Salinisphaera sp. Q1T1-3]|uniref:DnaJ family domain-containing protein n=1 Tax=Salinisphaera sp. Q1T1-3 TaxID=2321229 RepID=UPI000E73B09E|nr:DnaJ family domain-containing protein [Salinisphaera sp. Q1T1-3]RJS91503.1 DUF1992 domain-containing protein [Salinisphaera sp. Q1T1-3]
MSLLDRLADAHIETAAAQGAFDDLPGAGRPLPPDEARHVPEQLRAGYRLLKNAGCVPPEMASRQALREVEDLLAHAAPDSEENRRLTRRARRARRLELQLSQSPRGRALLADRDYADALRDRLTGQEKST